MKRWTCLEVDCDFSVTAASDDELVEAANAHVGEAHGSYELEEVVLAGAEEIERGRGAGGQPKGGGGVEGESPGD